MTYFKFQNRHILLAKFALNAIQKLTGSNSFILSHILFHLDENTEYCNRKRASTKNINCQILQTHFFNIIWIWSCDTSLNSYRRDHFSGTRFFSVRQTVLKKCALKKGDFLENLVFLGGLHCSTVSQGIIIP